MVVGCRRVRTGADIIRVTETVTATVTLVAGGDGTDISPSLAPCHADKDECSRITVRVAVSGTAA